MSLRQSTPRPWLIIVEEGGFEAAKRLPRGSGLILLKALPAGHMRRLRTLARQRQLKVVLEQPRAAARVHDSRELRRAMLARTSLILLSPLFPTTSHPGWNPIPRMRAAALARLAKRRLVALGGMNPKRYSAVAPLGFIGWAGISAWERQNRAVGR